MSCYLNPDLRVRIEQLEGKFAPRPLPLENGFSADKTYAPVGMFCPSESGEAYFIIPNDRDELWFISNRHLRFVAAGDQPQRSRSRGTQRPFAASPALLNSPF